MMIEVLLVDDEPALLEMAKNPFDPLVADYHMPEMSGIELLEIVRGRNDDIPFILIT